MNLAGIKIVRSTCATKSADMQQQMEAFIRFDFAAELSPKASTQPSWDLVRNAIARDASQGDSDPEVTSSPFSERFLLSSAR